MPTHHDLTTFVGREETLTELTTLVQQGTRLITLTGPPGIGKTRVASRFLTLHTHAQWCDLTEARTHDDVVGMVAATVGAPLPATISDAVAQVGRALASSPATLMVLDNFEQVAHCAASTLGQWLTSAANVTFLVTSRERLQLPGEHVLKLAPLDVPDPKDAAQDSAAVRLFVARAARVGSGFKLTEGNAADVVEIVRNLDGIPLAIELAAARMGVMTPAEASARLNARFDLLASGPRDGHARHRTLRAALDWSWSLLTPQEQSALAQCSVFKGTFTLDACHAVLHLPDQRGAWSLDVIQALVDKSLVARAPSKKTQRFRLYVSIAEYAAEKLGADAADAAARWRQHVMNHAAVLAAQMDTHRDADAVEELALEQENLIHMVRDAQIRNDASTALHAVLALDPLFSRRGPFDVHVTLLDAALELGERKGADVSLLARALEARGRIRQHRGRLDEGVADLARAYELATQAGDATSAGRSLAEMGSVQRRRGNNTEALSLFTRAMTLLAHLPDQRLCGRIHGELGILHKEQGELAEARAHYERALNMLRDAGDRRHEGRVIMDLGALHQEEGRMTEARTCFEGALKIHQAGGNKRFEALAWCDLGSLSLEEGRPADAETQLGRSVAILEEIGDRRTGARFEGILAAAHAALGKTQEATARFDHAEAELSRFGDVLFHCAVRVHRGQLDLAYQRAALLRGDETEARALTGRAQQRLQEGTRAGPAGEPSPSELSDDVRLAMRILRRNLKPTNRGGPELTVGPQCRWFQTPEGERVDLASRRTPARLLQLLVDKRVAEPGQALSPDALIAGGWPGERIGAEAALNRLHVTLATLRKLGLRSVLQRADDGYLLDARVPVTRSDA